MRLVSPEKDKWLYSKEDNYKHTETDTAGSITYFYDNYCSYEWESLEEYWKNEEEDRFGEDNYFWWCSYHGRNNESFMDILEYNTSGGDTIIKLWWSNGYVSEDMYGEWEDSEGAFYLTEPEYIIRLDNKFYHFHLKANETLEEGIRRTIKEYKGA